MHGGVVSRIDLVRIMPAPVEIPDVLIRPVRHHLRQLRILAEEMLAHIRPVLGLEGLVITIQTLHHPLAQQPRFVLREQRIPVATPDQFDDIPACATEIAFQLLDDLAVAAHRAIQPLQIAIHDENQVVEILARGHADLTHGLGFVHLAIAHEGPDLALRRATLRNMAPAFHVFHEAGLVNRLQGTQPHRHRRELPEIRLEPGVRIRRQAAPIDLAAEIVELLLRHQPHQESAGIKTRRGVALQEDHVAAVRLARRIPEMVEPDIEQRSR